jgi:uncharacterized protein with PIN domain
MTDRPRYGRGDRYCSKCERVFRDIERCPDCNGRLRSAPKDGRLRLQLGITTKFARLKT